MRDMGDNAKNFTFKAKTVNVVIGDHPVPGGAPAGIDIIGKAQGLAILLNQMSPAYRDLMIS